MAQTVTLENLRQDYEPIAKFYDTRWQPLLAACHDWVLARLGKPHNVLDLGCGTGRLLSQINAHYPKAALTGIDASPAMLEIASAWLGNASLYFMDIEHPEPLPSPYDTVLSINVLHHLNDPVGHIGSLHNLCTENGNVFLCDFAIEGVQLNIAEQYWRLCHPAHHRAFSRMKLRPMITEKFEVIDEALLKPDGFWKLQIYKLRIK